MKAPEYYLELYGPKSRATAPKDYPAMLRGVIEATIERYPKLTEREKDALKLAVFEDARTYCEQNYHDIKLADCDATLAEINKRLDAVPEIGHSSEL
jgi:hypothetical protein